MTVTKSAAEALGLTTGGAEVISETVTTSPGTEVARTKVWTDEELLNLSTENLWEHFGRKGLKATDAGVLGNGFTLMDTDDKRKLVGVDLYILEAQHRVDPVDGADFWTMLVITKDNKKYIVNDGSTGIAEQLKVAVAKGVQFPMRVVKGLRVSDYTFTDEKGNKKPASTYYIDTTPAS